MEDKKREKEKKGEGKVLKLSCAVIFSVCRRLVLGGGEAIHLVGETLSNSNLL